MFKNTRLFLALVYFFTVFQVYAQTEADTPFFLEQKRFQGELKEGFADLDPNFSQRLFRFDILEGVNIAARYKYEVERSHKVGFHTRVDHWSVVTSVNPGDRIDKDFPLNFGLSRGNSIYFIRQFKSKMDAIKALPYTPLRMPVTAQRAIDKLNIGDFVSIPSKLTFTVGYSKDLSEGPSSPISSYFFVSGEFIVNIIKMKDNKVQVRVIAQSGKTQGGGAGYGFSFKAFEVFVGGKEISKVIDLDLAKLGFSQSKGNQLVLDYIYDLNDPDAAKAYEALLSSSLKFKDYDLLKDYFKKNDIEDTVVSTYLLSDKVHFEDVDKNPKNKRVTRLFKGFNNFKNSKLNFGFNIKLARLHKNRTLSKNILVEEKSPTEKDYYLFHNYAVSNNHSWGVWPIKIKERNYTNLYALLQVDKDNNSIERYPDIGYSLDMRDMKLGKREFNKFLNSLHKNIPQEILANIDWKQWEEEVKRNDSLIFSNIILNRHAFDEIPDMSREDLHEELKAYRKRKRDETDTPFGIKDLTDFDPVGWALNPMAMKIASKRLFHFLYDDMLDSEQKLNMIMSLRRNHVFREVGFGFLLSLIPPQKLAQHIYFNMELQAADVEPLKFTFGREEHKEFYEYLQYITWALNGRSYDRRVVQ